MLAIIEDIEGLNLKYEAKLELVPMSIGS